LKEIEKTEGTEDESKAVNRYMKSPITGEMIPVEEMSEHMRISLIDPRHADARASSIPRSRTRTHARHAHFTHARTQPRARARTHMYTHGADQP
jgi:splicing factor 3A subunit 1